MSRRGNGGHTPASRNDGKKKVHDTDAVSQQEDTVLSRMKSFLSGESVARIYDERYGSGGSYRARFGSRSPKGEARVFAKAVSESTSEIKKNNTEWSIDAREKSVEGRVKEIVPHRVSLLDFGCGEGRSLPLFQQLANGLKHQKDVGRAGDTLRVKAYDISVAGINAYKARLEESGFRRMDEDGLAEIYHDRKLVHLKGHGVFRKDNLEVELLSGDPEITPEQLREDIRNVDITTVLFGSASHIFPSDLRDEFLRMILEVTNNHVAMTVPGKAMFLENQKSISLFRDALGLGDGEIFYQPDNMRAGAPLLPYALYDADTLRACLNGVDGRDVDISISSYKAHPTTASKSAVVDVVDDAASCLLSKMMKSFPRVTRALPKAITRPEYFGVVVKGNAKEEPSAILRSISVVSATAGESESKGRV